MSHYPHGHDMPNAIIYWAVIGVELSGANPACDGCGPGNNIPFSMFTNGASKTIKSGGMTYLTIPKDATIDNGYTLQGDWKNDHKNALLGAKLFHTIQDANNWIENHFNSPYPKADGFFAKYKYVIAVPVKISTAFLGE